MRNILQRDNQKRDKKIQHKHIPHCSRKSNSEKRVRRGWKPEENNEYIYLKLKAENNIKRMLLKICL